MESAQIREAFLAYFRERGHTIVASASLIPAQDPTLLFTNAGMVPFKDVFLGSEQRSYTRAASVQKCMRVSGKHNDLDEVGPSPQHQTFFEMLGNFSFGDYFKDEALAFSWEFLTKEMGLPGDRLHPTVYEDDAESAEIWARIKGVPASSVVRLGAEYNFWSMGETGPCGPNSEIIFDRTGSCLRDGSDCDITCDCDRWWELWNNVFMQFDRAADGTLTPLPKKGVDTGLGFERLVAVLQGVDSNYGTDVFVPLIDRLRELTGDAEEIPKERLAAYRAVADHARALSFLIADGIVPSNDGRGYVLRRILRRASYQGKLLGLDEPFVASICEQVIEHMGDAYPELRESANRITELVSGEEERFLVTLESGLSRLEDALAGAGETKVLPGEEAFRLYDTYGFPIDLTRKVLEARGLTVDEAGFERALEEQRQRARAAREEERGRDEALFGLARDLDATTFVGYDTFAADATVIAIFGDDGRREGAAEGDEVEVVLDTTPFYAEAGGQVGDTGRITGPDGEITVDAVRGVAHGVSVHRGRVTLGRVAEGDAVHAEVDETTRRATMRNHTATHLLHKALRNVLGSQAKQAGSLVAPDRLRFDFLHGKPLSDAELREVERIVRAQVMLDQPVHKQEMPTQEALSLGADAMFDEKYGERARVISVGDGEPFSRELCGGTHCGATGEIGAFFIIDQRSVGAGVRRIEAVTGAGAFDWIDARRRVVDELSREYNVPPAELPQRIHALRERVREAPAAVRNLPDPAEVIERAEQLNGSLLIIDKVDASDATALRDFGDELRKRAKSAAVVLGSVLDGKPSVIIMLTPDQIESGHHAGKLAKQIGKEMGAGGGGRRDVATAGGRDPAALDSGLALAKDLLRRPA